jgi:transcriptional regulator GlxA family with amidase domain
MRRSHGVICRIDGASDHVRERILPRMRDRPPPAGELSVGMILFDGVMLLDVAGPAEVFASANRNAREAGVSRRYRVRTYGVGGGQVRSEAGVVLVPDTSLPVRLARSRPRCRRIVSVCTGAYALCESGLAAGRRITTHWRFAGDLARRYPDVEVDARALHLVAGDLGSSAGITAGIDLCLALVEEDCGHSVALATARELVVYMRRSGGQDQYSEPLRLEAGRGDRVGELVARLLAQPGGDARLDVLGAQAHLSPRQLQRRVLQRYGCSVSELVARIRLHEAQRLLCGRHALAEIAGACGYVDTDAFSRAFLRQTGLRPSEWRARFAKVDREDAFHHEPEVVE